MTETIALIGAGNMAQALIGGLIQRGHPAANLRAADPAAANRQKAEAEFGIRTFADNAEAVHQAALVILCVKPQVIDEAAESIAEACLPETVIASVAAGIPLARLQRHFGPERAIVRVMPNTPALHGCGATGLFAGPACSEDQTARVRRAFEAVGRVFEVDDEALMDVVTAVSGSGPAYFFALTEALAAAGEAAGLNSDIARGLAVQTAAGAGVMLDRDPAGPAELRRRVTSPGGTTAAALQSLEHNGFAAVVDSAVRAAIARGRELGAQE